jgi:hypothetical protein
LPHLILAKVQSDGALFTYPTGWSFRYAGGTTPCTGSACWSTTLPSTLSLRNSLSKVAQSIAPEFSVQWMTHNGDSRWILVHGGKVPLINLNGSDYTGTPPAWLAVKVDANFRQIVMRSSTLPTSFPGSANGATGSSGSTVRADTIAKNLTEPGTGNAVNAADPKVVSGYNALRSVHAVKGHAEISEPGNVTVTYYVWDILRCTTSQQTCTKPSEFDLYYTAADAGATGFTDSPKDGHLGNSISSLRALKFPLKYVRPWCTQESPSTCP